MTRPTIGALLREWRIRRRRSQLELSIDVGVSTRHLSFVETGRSKPSVELVLAIAHHLDVPLRERNTMLLAAGFAPRYANRALDDPAMRVVVGSLQRMLDAHSPYPGVVIDRRFNVVLANDAAVALTAGLPNHLVEPAINVFTACLHPDGLSSRTLNFGDWATYLLRQLRRVIERTADAELVAIEREILGYPNLVGIPRAHEIGVDDDPPLLVPLRLSAGEVELSMFTTLTTFGTPQDITLEELSVELFFPADAETEVILRSGRSAVSPADA